MEFLKDLLKEYVEAEKIDEFIDKFNKEVPKHMMPKGKFNEINEELKISKQQLAENKTMIDELTGKASTAEEYQKQIEALQAKNTQIETEYQNKIGSITKKSAFKDLLLQGGMHKDAVDLYINSSDLTTLELSDGKLLNPDTLLKQAKEEKAGLFIEIDQDSTIKKEQKDDPNVNEAAAFMKGLNL